MQKRKVENVAFNHNASQTPTSAFFKIGTLIDTTDK